MAVISNISAIGYFMPILAFLLVFIIIYALLRKTEILGSSEPVMLFVSFILASFFVVEASLVEFVRFGSAWFGVFIVMIFFILATVAFMPWKEPFNFLTKNDWFSWMLLGVIFVFFVLSSIYVFDWVVNWETVQDWFDSEWFGLVLLLAIAAVVSWTIKTK